MNQLKEKYHELNLLWKNMEKSLQNIEKTEKEQKKKINSLENTLLQVCSEIVMLEKYVQKSNHKQMDEIARIKIPYKRVSESPLRGRLALEKLINEFTFETVLDIGCGEGIHTESFLKAGKEVTAIDYGKSDYFMKCDKQLDVIIADFNEYEFHKKFDCIWCSHILEHQLNVNFFLKKLFSLLEEGSILAVSVPPAKQEIVGGHVSLWNAGLLLYNLILAGFDCSNAIVMQYDYDISIIVKKKSISSELYRSLSYDAGDILKLKEFFPQNIPFHVTKRDATFDGEQLNLNWEADELEHNITFSNNLPKKKGGGEKPCRWIEITTKIGCSNNCAYCPQDKLIASYCANEKNKLKMTLADFIAAVKHIPKWLDICFTGMNEPFENDEAFSMLKYACQNNYHVHVYTTLKSLTYAQIEGLRDLKIKSFVIHLPDKDQMMALNVDNEYLKKLMAFYNLKLKNVRYVCIGDIHPSIPKVIAQNVKCDKEIILRAGNVVRNQKMKNNLNYHKNCGHIFDDNTAVICTRRLNYHREDRKATHVETTVLMPNGTLVLCCNDFSLQHPLGNLYEQDYESIMYGQNMQRIEASMMCETQMDLLCRKCEFACEYNKDKWVEFIKKGTY